MASTLGMSQSLIRMIERRTSGDKVILLSGMLLIALLLYGSYVYLK
jgi:multisubunit Na+/H+ antiporter MnhF subunit